MKKIAVCGACGKMGQRIIKTISEKEDKEVVSAIEAPDSPKIGENIGETIGIEDVNVEVKGADQLEKELSEKDPDVIIDFTIADAAVENVEKSAKNGVPTIVGTTGLSDKQKKKMEEAIKKSGTSAVIAPNMSLGVNTFFKIVEKVAKILDEYDMELIESHHNQKVDAPSGTAMTAAKIAAKASNKDFEEVAEFGREKGEHGERPEDEIGIHSVRAGNIAGDHKFLFAGPNERLEITHKAQSRQAFVQGVMEAIDFLMDMEETGKVLDMQDVLFKE